MSGRPIADRRLWFTDDKSELVEEGDPRAAFLAAIPGREIPDVGQPAVSDDETVFAASSITVDDDNAESVEGDEPEPEVDLDDYASGHGWYEYEGEKMRRSELAELLGVEDD